MNMYSTGSKLGIGPRKYPVCRSVCVHLSARKFLFFYSEGVNAGIRIRSSRIQRHSEQCSVLTRGGQTRCQTPSTGSPQSSRLEEGAGVSLTGAAASIIFVATKVWTKLSFSGQKYVCRHKGSVARSILLSRHSHARAHARTHAPPPPPPPHTHTHIHRERERRGERERDPHT